MISKYLSKLIISVLLLSFLGLYFGSALGIYKVNSNTLSNKDIERFEKDLASGLEIDPKNYLNTKKDYNNRASIYGRKVSKLIEKSFNKTLSFKYILPSFK